MSANDLDTTMEINSNDIVQTLRRNWNLKYRQIILSNLQENNQLMQIIKKTFQTECHFSCIKLKYSEKKNNWKAMKISAY